VAGCGVAGWQAGATRASWVGCRGAEGERAAQGWLPAVWREESCTGCKGGRVCAKLAGNRAGLTGWWWRCTGRSERSRQAEWRRGRVGLDSAGLCEGAGGASVVHGQEGQPTADTTSTRGGRRPRVAAQEECVRAARATWLDGSAMVAGRACAERDQHLPAAVQHLVIALPVSPSRRESS
jgi:hypothetical protein